MPYLSECTENLTSLVPEHITEHLEKITSRYKKVSARTSLLLDFVWKRRATTRPDERTFTALRDAIVDRINPNWREQTIAAWALGRADLTNEQQKEATDLLAFLLDYSGRTRGQWYGDNVGTGIAYAIGWSFAGIAFSAMLYTVASLLKIDPFDYPCFWIACTLFFIITPSVPFITVSNLASMTNTVRWEAARSLGSLKRAEGVSSLLRASQNTEFFWNIGIHALNATLPSLTFEQHYGSLGSDVVPNLCRLLNISFDLRTVEAREWQLVLLDALEKVGDARALPLLTLISQYDTSTKGNPAVPQKIAQVLKVLWERISRETEQATLLRGSEAPVLPDTLLRSYEESIETPPEQLLRPTNSLGKKEEAE
ncbi:MAG: hypothetical protein H7308_05800 [Chthonomonadaceae bacterium]|nr:hypothetical protein [Chthonomonadaceae bacterium]